MLNFVNFVPPSPAHACALTHIHIHPPTHMQMLLELVPSELSVHHWGFDTGD